MQIRDWYIGVLEKRAMDGTDSQEMAHKELESNQVDQRSELKGLFNQAPVAEKAETKSLTKNFPLAKKTEGTASSSTLLKVAMNRAFFGGARNLEFLKLADPEYLRTAFQGFENEIEKIASGC